MDDFYNGRGENKETDSMYSYRYEDIRQDDTRDTRSYYDAGYGPERQRSRPAGARRKPGFGRMIGRCVVLAAVFGLVSGGIFAGVNRIAGTKTAKEADAREEAPVKVEKTSVGTETTGVGTEDAANRTVTVSDVSAIVDRVMPSIVAITNMSQTEYYNWFGQPEVYDSQSCGSGIIISDDDEYLYIATNNHVVADASSLTICFYDDSTVAAEVKGTDQGTDLAVVSVKKSDLQKDTLSGVKIAVMGDSEALKVGQPAIAIGNALGYGQSVTTGVISALNREVTVGDSAGNTVTNELLQTDAAINPGNSGGALLNINGEVIGINSTKYADTDVEGMGYAIPAGTAGPIIEELITREKVGERDRAFLGVVGVDVTDEISRVYDMPEGLYIAQVSAGSAAARAGIQRGDILTAFDGHRIDSQESLEEQLQYYSAGQEITVTVMRADDGVYQESELPITLGSKK